MHSDEFLHATLRELALGAGLRIMAASRAGVAVEHKADGSPVTGADVAAEAFILDGLARQCRGIPCVAEEQVAAGYAPGALGRQFFLIDALDGTREFIAGSPDFTVNIGLVRDGRPVIGVVYAPARRQLYSGWRGGATVTTYGDDLRPGPALPIAARPCPDGPVVVVSRSRPPGATTTAFIARHAGAQVRAVGASLKFCLLASGQADFYPCFGRTMEWDTAAGHAVLLAAGGRVRTDDGAELGYAKRRQADADFANPWFVAEGASA